MLEGRNQDGGTHAQDENYIKRLRVSGFTFQPSDQAHDLFSLVSGSPDWDDGLLVLLLKNGSTGILAQRVPDVTPAQVFPLVYEAGSLPRQPQEFRSSRPRLSTQRRVLGESKFNGIRDDPTVGGVAELNKNAITGIPVFKDIESPYAYTWNAADMEEDSLHRIEARAYALYATTGMVESDIINVRISDPAPPLDLKVKRPH